MHIDISDDARVWQKIARDYADNYLQPHEVEAELNDGVLPKEITQRNKLRAIELGFTAIDVPRSHGGLELPMESQVAIWEQLGRVTNALSWCFPGAFARRRRRSALPRRPGQRRNRDHCQSEVQPYLRVASSDLPVYGRTRARFATRRQTW